MKHNKITVLEERDWLLKRPSIFLGATTFTKQEFFFSDEGKFKEIIYLPALQKLFDEVLENAIDENIRTKGKYATNISVDVNDDNSITVYDSGRGLEISKHHQYPDQYIPEVIFTKLRSGSNFEDIERNTIGVNGVGVSLVVLFSSKFTIKTQNNNKIYKQVFSDMLLEKTEPSIKLSTSDNTYTEITFLPNFEYFKVDGWNKELIKKRVFDLAFLYPDIKFKFNGEKIQAKKFKDYIQNYSAELIYEEGDNGKLIVSTNDLSDAKFVSFINGAHCFQGGSHIDYIYQELVNNLRPKLEKIYKLSLRPQDIKNHISIFSQLNINNPTFSTQTKEKIINSSDEIKPLLNDILTDKFYKKILNNKIIVEKIVEEARAKKALQEQIDTNKKQKQIIKKKVHKLIDANGFDREKCILFLTEGDSACASGNLVRDTKLHGFLPLRGKVLNVRDLPTTKVLANEEIQDILNSVGLRVGSKADNLRFGKIVLLTDEDPDGSAIKALLINFFFKYWKELFEQRKICFLKTPLYIAKIKDEKTYLYDMKDLESFKLSHKKDTYKLTYFKGLGGLEEADWEYFLNTNPLYETVSIDCKTDDKLEMSFGDDSVRRKEWLLK